MLYGASYYHEYQPQERLAVDLDLMVEAGFSLIRVGESTWSSYEPEDGSISFAALRAVVDAAADRGLKVIVGTPTYAVPPWLARRHPQVMAQTSATHTLPYGGRQNVNFTDPTYLRYAERIVRAIGTEFGKHPAVIGFQVDNEIGVYQLTNPNVVDRFRHDTSRRLGGVDGINDKWGLTYWSQRLSSIEDLWAPDGNTNPGYALEWWRFQSALTTGFLSWQRDLLRQVIDEDKFVFHDSVGGDSQGNTALRPIAETLDHTATNIYLPLQAALQLPQLPADDLAGLAPWWLVDAGPSIPQWKADLAFSLKGSRGSAFAITEAQAGSIGDQATNTPPFPGQLRLLTHLYASRGADLLAYWHWHTLHYGNEMFWEGVLGHSLGPGRIYEEVAHIGHELKELQSALAGFIPDSDVTILYSRESLKALEFMPPLLQPGTAHPDATSYHRIFMRLYSSAVDTGAQVRVVHPDSDWTGEDVLLVPALYIADDDLLQRLTRHAEAGAHVVFTFRSGYADEWARARWEKAPGALRPGVGASYDESTTLVHPVRLTATTSPEISSLALGDDAAATSWADLLTPESAETLLGYDDPFLGRYAAATTQAVGSGRITWLGTLPDPESTSRILRWALTERGTQPTADVWTHREETVRVTSGVNAEGSRLWFLANHSWTPTNIQTPDGMTLAHAHDGVICPDEFTLGAWDSVILQEREP
ncbi:beta-galactosidase [Frondihabitans sucicola]|uniref:beta-galactosidase n=1 Tax=Frondihabitans sucicola TaxID=1268041 RepID=A0ABM8GHX7_9MICO|nr:beta-galactosidase [Frondihabitans sucicola]BDZ47969.1 beta-galactosidase [Frondihabitans sucicola]